MTEVVKIYKQKGLDIMPIHEQDIVKGGCHLWSLLIALAQSSNILRFPYIQEMNIERLA